MMKLNLLSCAVRDLFTGLAKEQNPVLGYYDPIGLAGIDLWGQGTEASIGARTLQDIEKIAEIAAWPWPCTVSCSASADGLSPPPSPRVLVRSLAAPRRD